MSIPWFIPVFNFIYDSLALFLSVSLYSMLVYGISFLSKNVYTTHYLFVGNILYCKKPILLVYSNKYIPYTHHTVVDFYIFTYFYYYNIKTPPFVSTEEEEELFAMYFVYV